MSESGLSIIIKNAIETGRLISAGALTLDGKVIFQPSQQPGTADEYGWLPPETDFGGSQNEKINEIRKEWESSSDKVKRQAVKNVPKLFVAFTQFYQPEVGSEAFEMFVHNNNVFAGAGSGHLRPLMDYRYSGIKDHLFLSMGNSYHPDSEGYPDLMEKLLFRYRQMLDQAYSDIVHGPLNQRP